MARRSYPLTTNERVRQHHAFIDQVRKVALSIPANISEGYALGTTRQFIRHLRIALGSAAELRTHLEIGTDVGLLAESESTPALAEVDRLISVLIGLLRRLGAQTPQP